MCAICASSRTRWNGRGSRATATRITTTTAGRAGQGNAEGVQEGQAMTFHIPGFVVFLILASLWWEYCWKPARAQWKLDQWRRHQAKYPPTPEPFTPEWYEYIYKDDIPGLIARKYWGHLAGRISDAQG